MEIDPLYITQEYWVQLNVVVDNFCFFVLFMVLFALNTVLTHNVIPSHVKAHELPPVFSKIRIPIYGFGFVLLAAASYFFIRSLTVAIDVLNIIYPDWWI